MRARDTRSREIVEILADVVARVSDGCRIKVPDLKGGETATDCPPVHYVFGNAMYVKEHLDELSKTASGSVMKYPLIALFCPFVEKRNDPDFHSKAKVRVLIAHATSRDWSNMQRLHSSFQNVLRPIYDRFIEELEADGRFDFGYDGHVAHDYSENYSYGRYGAYTENGEQVSDPIDAINITNLELNVKQINCKQQ